MIEYGARQTQGCYTKKFLNSKLLVIRIFQIPGNVAIQSSCSYTPLQVPALGQFWGQHVGLWGPSDLVQLFLGSRVAIQDIIQMLLFQSPFLSRLFRGIFWCMLPLFIFPVVSVQKKEVKIKHWREWLWSWLGSTATKLWTLPLFTVSENIRPLELVSKFFENSCLYKLFYLQRISFWSKYCTYDQKFLLIMWLKINKQMTIEELQ